MKVLVTGGAGFIGSNLVEVLLLDDRVSLVRVLDNLSTGHIKNLSEFHENEKFEFFQGDICDFDTCVKATHDVDLISHQAALGSVPRSITDPLTTNHVNISGTLNVFNAAIQSKVKRVVFAASSSTYGDNEELPKRENKIGNPLSPYAVTKLVNELYAEVFSKTYQFEYVGLRYFNVFGPKQDPNGAYAAVIPLFMKAALSQESPLINGDGSYSRDFTYVSNAVQANVLGLFTSDLSAINEVYNVACGQRTTLNELWTYIQKVSQRSLDCDYGPARLGDVPHSLADITKAKDGLGYIPRYDVLSGLQLTYDWYKLNNL